MRAWLAAAVLLAWGMAAGESAQAQVTVTLPNGGAQLQGATLSYSSGGGGRSGSAGSSGSSSGGSGLSSGNGGLRWDGREWKLASQWESLSQSWKNLTGSQMGLGSTGGGGGEPSCWVWVDEDWEPSPEMVTIGGGGGKPVVVDGVVQMPPLVPIRSTPFSLAGRPILPKKRA